MRQQKRVTVFDQEQHDGEWPPTDATEFAAWFAGKLGEIPGEYMASAKIEIDSAGGYEGSHYGHIEIYYDRPETDDEMTSREAGELRRKIELLEYLCSEEKNSRIVFDWVLKWIAYPIQHPGAKMRTALIFHGPQGTGKNLFFEGEVRIMRPNVELRGCALLRSPA